MTEQLSGFSCVAHAMHSCGAALPTGTVAWHGSRPGNVLVVFVAFLLQSQVILVSMLSSSPRLHNEDGDLIAVISLTTPAGWLLDTLLNALCYYPHLCTKFSGETAEQSHCSVYAIGRMHKHTSSITILVAELILFLSFIDPHCFSLNLRRITAALVA